MARRGFAFDIRDARTDLRSGATSFERRLLRPLHRGAIAEACRDAALRLSPGWRNRLAQHQARNRALAESVLERSGKRMIVDSSKIGLRLKYLLRTPDLDIRIVRLVRDGRAVALTYTDPAAFADARDPALKGGGTGANRDHLRLTMASAAREWRRSNEEAQALLAGVDPSKWIEVRYEELCAAPLPTMRRVFEFVGADPEAASVQFRSGPHHVVGNGMRLDTTEAIRLDDRWQTALSPDQLDTFAAVAGDLNRRLGYI